MRVLVPLGSGTLRRIGRIEAKGDNLKVSARLQGERPQRSNNAAQNLAAQHRTCVVNGREQHRLAIEVFPEWNARARFVAKLGVDRNAGIKVLFDTDAFSVGRLEGLRRTQRS